MQIRLRVHTQGVNSDGERGGVSEQRGERLLGIQQHSMLRPIQFSTFSSCDLYLIG